ncbi:ABC transporter substrate-binding protein [uncultured Arcobacter sp.]|uniref:ABC transporter substrate-binding protein n=1 Tax=uncultured Arcobacter sp. TaxID=165434 RepID=UPI00261D6D98|nr:ABC transporter substrate-binding protein [uncultured Arcobacter sp.]
MKFIVAFLTVVNLFFSGCTNETEVKTFSIGTNIWPGYEPLHLAKIQNEYKNNVDVITYDSATIVLNKFRNKEIEGAALTLDEVILLKDQGYNPVIIAVLDVSEGADVLLCKPNINSLSELKDKSIGVENSALGSYILTRVLELAKLTNNDIQLVPLGVNQHEGAFDDNVVDAVITFEPVRSELLKKGAKEIFTSKDIPGEIVDVLVVRKEFLDSKYIEDILQAWEISSKQILSGDSKAISLISKRLNQSSSEFINSLDGLSIPTREKSNTMLKDGSLRQTILKIQNVMLEKKLIKKEIDVESVIY